MIPVAGKPCRLIATEEHYLDPEWVELTSQLARSNWNDMDLEDIRWINHPGTYVHAPLCDIGEARLKKMDEAGIDMSILSLAVPGVQLFDAATATSLATSLNDRLAETVKRHPTRFGGLAVFAPNDPAGAVKEIDRAMNHHKLNGLVVYSHTQGEYLDNPKFFPILEAAEALNAAIYLHPRNPPPELRRFLQNSAGEDVMTSAGYGFGMEAALHASRLIACGIFDRFPKLTIVLGHMGEGLPYSMYRTDKFAQDSLKRLPSEYMRENFFITTSGLYDHPLCAPQLSYCRTVLGTERMVFATDYPFQNMKEASDVLRDAPLPAEDIAKIAHLNAAKLFHIG
jgi:5-carboxyvanillate decarboxylase